MNSFYESKAHLATEFLDIKTGLTEPTAHQGFVFEIEQAGPECFGSHLLATANPSIFEYSRCYANETFRQSSCYVPLLFIAAEWALSETTFGSVFTCVVFPELVTVSVCVDSGHALYNHTTVAVLSPRAARCSD